LLQAMQDGDVKTAGEDRVYLIKGEEAVDLLTGKTVKPAPDNVDDVVVNNRLRRELGMAIAALRLPSGDRASRLAAAKELQGGAITYGLMGVINMAHGELIMIGAYATYIVQNLFRQHWPNAFDAYLVCAIPVAFAVSAAVGMVLERTVIRFLYGRPLETLLA